MAWVYGEAMEWAHLWGGYRMRPIKIISGLPHEWAIYGELPMEWAIMWARDGLSIGYR